ncbi:hypothetical protein F4782DRAFT_535932 [Xylaria castorea]|nr:hypothetical protein F4782DRAFT_535932 [Xylaria castorea]
MEGGDLSSTISVKVSDAPNKTGVESMSVVWAGDADSRSLEGEEESDAIIETEDSGQETDDDKNSQSEAGRLVEHVKKTLKPRPFPMPYGRLVKFSSSPPLRAVALAKNLRLGIFDVQVNNVDALRETLSHAIEDISNLKSKYQMKNNEETETRNKYQDTEALYRDAIERNQIIQAEVEVLEKHMDKKDVALKMANRNIRHLESDVSEWKDKCEKFHEFHEAARLSAHTSVISVESWRPDEHSQGLGPRANSKPHIRNTRHDRWSLGAFP